MSFSTPIMYRQGLSFRATLQRESHAGAVPYPPGRSPIPQRPQGQWSVAGLELDAGPMRSLRQVVLLYTWTRLPLVSLNSLVQIQAPETRLP